MPTRAVPVPLCSLRSPCPATPAGASAGACARAASAPRAARRIGVASRGPWPAQDAQGGEDVRPEREPPRLRGQGQLLRGDEGDPRCAARPWQPRGEPCCWPRLEATVPSRACRLSCMPVRACRPVLAGGPCCRRTGRRVPRLHAAVLLAFGDVAGAVVRASQVLGARAGHRRLPRAGTEVLRACSDSRIVISDR